MTYSRAFVVGDRFEAFANGLDRLTEAQFLSLRLEKLQSIRHLTLGQGLGTPSLHRLNRFLEQTGMQERIEVEEYLSQKIDCGSVHKRLEVNVLVTRPRKMDSESFRANLVVDEDCAELSDHITGIHMQGALFIEATRQMFYGCVGEIHDADGESPGQHTYIMSELHASYRQFLYPLPIQIVLHVDKLKELRRSGLVSYDASLQFRQGGETGVEVAVKVLRCSEEAMIAREMTGATRLLDNLSAVRTRAPELVS